MRYRLYMRLVMTVAICFVTICAAAQQSEPSAASLPETRPTHLAIERMMPAADCEKLADGMQHGEELLSFCKWVLTFRERLPNILVDEKMERTALVMGSWRPLDTVTMLAHY